MLAEIVPGLGKRLILLIGLTVSVGGDAGNRFGKVFSPIEVIEEAARKKRD